MSSMTKAAGVLVFQACCKRILSLHCTDNVLFSEIFESSRCCLSLLVLSQDPEEKKHLQQSFTPNLKQLLRTALSPSDTLVQKKAAKKTTAVPHGPLMSHTIAPPKAI